MKRTWILLGTIFFGVFLVGMQYSAARGMEARVERSPNIPLDTGISYQGFLSSGGEPANGVFTFTFTLYDDPVAGNQVGVPDQHPAVEVINGLFTVVLDFGDVFMDEALWVEIAVSRTANDVGAVLSPRQALRPVPFAHFARLAGSVPWSGLTGIPAGLEDGDDDTLYASGSGLFLSGATFNVLFGGSGSVDSAARSDHTHDGNYAALLHTHTGDQITTAVPTATLALSTVNANVAGYANTAPWGGLSGIPTGFMDGVDNDALGRLDCEPGEVAKWSGAVWLCGEDNIGTGGGGGDITAVLAGDGLIGGARSGDATLAVNFAGTGILTTSARSDHDHPGLYWELGGNTITDPRRNYLGTTDAVSMTLGVSRTAALRIFPNDTAPILVGGAASNQVNLLYSPGAFIGGGSFNFASGFAAVIGGGSSNSATGNVATIGGGLTNVAASEFSFVGGGQANYATGEAAVVGGGYQNLSTGSNATVSGGANNESSASYAAIGGGQFNEATTSYGTIGGGAENRVAAYAGTVGGGVTNVVSGTEGTIGGGSYNIASGNNAAIAGGFSNLASNFAASIAGGYDNTASGYIAVIGGGSDNSAIGQTSVVAGGYANNAFGAASTIGGGEVNFANGSYSTVAGGYSNSASDFYAFVGGGRNNSASADYAVSSGGYDNSAAGQYSTVSGGHLNTSTGSYAAIGGGVDNTSFGLANTIGGGESNFSNGSYATIGGGYNNQAANEHAYVGGGIDNEASGQESVVGGGNTNIASGNNAAVGGGYENIASGISSVVPGGEYNLAAGAHSFAAGMAAKANNRGCFVWADATIANFNCNTDNRFQARASGGVYLYTDSGLTSGMYLSAGGSSWNAVSDVNRKENFEAINPRKLLENLANIEISTWNYITQDDSIRHIGPTAQDFNALLPELGGEGEEYINTLDADGVALAAIQGLYEIVQEQNAQIAELEARIKLQVSGETEVVLMVGGVPVGWFLLAGILVAGMYLTRRREARVGLS